MKELLGRIARPSVLKRYVFFYTSDAVLIVLALFLSFLFHFDFNPNIDYLTLVREAMLYFVIIKIVVFSFFRIYSMSWRYMSIGDLFNIILALVFSESLLIVASLPNSYLSPLSITGFPKRIFLVDGIVSILLVTGLRISKRVYLEILTRKGTLSKGKRTVILGAGGTGEMILRDMARLGYEQFYPVGLLDDDHLKIGTYMRGIKVHGRVDDLADVVAKHLVEAVIIAIPTLNHKKLKQIYSIAKKTGVGTIKIVPRIYDFDKPDLRLKSLEDISIEDLIGRQVVQIDYDIIKEFVKEKTILITGAGGSIGSELVMQICAFQPDKIVLFDIDETELHAMNLKLNKYYPELLNRAHYIIGDVRDEKRVGEVFQEFKPNIVFHAAAYKHVPMMEDNHNAKEAVKVNIFGTNILANASLGYGVERFVMISTDKAVQPTSVMGATKRIAEYICQAMNKENGNRKGQTQQGTRFVSVRFGNVLGSRGSVIPLFLAQLKNGGPLTVTHKDMVRYFMTIPEAVSLILQASTMGEGGEIFVLDMGEPVKIVELAEELIALHGMEAYRDVDIEFTGLRPGEKIFEEILTAEEGTVASKHEKVFIARNNGAHSLSQIDDILKRFEAVIDEPSAQGESRVKNLLKQYVKHYEEN